MVIRIALYSHDSVGLGHVRRNLALAHALSKSLPELTGEAVTGMLITGQSAATSFSAPSGWDWMVLPSITTGDDGYTSERLTTDIGRITALRGGAVRGALGAFGPDLVIVDRHPFGVRGELRGALHDLRAQRPECAIVLGLRDVLDSRTVARAEWKAIGGSAAVRESFDAIWVYGDPAVHDITETGELPRGLRHLVRHTGYLSHGRPVTQDSSVDTPFVLTTVGGGSDGRAIAETAARAEPPEGLRHIVVTGPEMPEADLRAVHDGAHPATTVVKSAPDVLALLREASAAIIMGGYNTVCEAMATSTPVLVVPRVARRREQLIRAESLLQCGAIDFASITDVTPHSFTDWFARNAAIRRPRAHLDLDGLSTVGPLAADMLAARQATGVLPHAV